MNPKNLATTSRFFGGCGLRASLRKNSWTNSRPKKTFNCGLAPAHGYRGVSSDDPGRLRMRWKRSKSATERFPGIATSFSTVRDPTKRPAPVWRCCCEPKESPGFARSKAGSTLASRTISLSLPKASSRSPLSSERRYFSQLPQFVRIVES